MSWIPDIVIYHDPCMDGFTAAWAIWQRWGDKPDYVARNYGMEPPAEIKDKNVLIVDFSFPENVLRKMVNDGAASIVILDHHKTAQADLAPFQFKESSAGAISPDDIWGMMRDLNELDRPPILAVFDMERSGAGMAWDFALPDIDRPALIELVEDRDLWRFAHGDSSKHLHLALSAGARTFERWSAINVSAAISEGTAIASWRDNLVTEIIERAYYGSIGGKRGILVDCPYSIASDVCHAMLDKHVDAQFSAAIVRSEDSVTFSLRSRDDRADVSEIAKKFGGGGHRNAAGFRVPAA